jgi:hypothetical protein
MASSDEGKVLWTGAGAQPSMRAIAWTIKCAGGFSAQQSKISPASARVRPSMSR